MMGVRGNGGAGRVRERGVGGEGEERDGGKHGCVGGLGGCGCGR